MCDAHCHCHRQKVTIRQDGEGGEKNFKSEDELGLATDLEDASKPRGPDVGPSVFAATVKKKVAGATWSEAVRRTCWKRKRTVCCCS